MRWDSWARPGLWPTREASCLRGQTQLHPSGLRGSGRRPGARARLRPRRPRCPPRPWLGRLRPGPGVARAWGAPLPSLQGPLPRRCRAPPRPPLAPAPAAAASPSPARPRLTSKRQRGGAGGDRGCAAQPGVGAAGPPGAARNRRSWGRPPSTASSELGEGDTLSPSCRARQRSESRVPYPHSTDTKLRPKTGRSLLSICCLLRGHHRPTVYSGQGLPGPPDPQDPQDPAAGGGGCPQQR